MGAVQGCQKLLEAPRQAGGAAGSSTAAGWRSVQLQAGSLGTQGRAGLAQALDPCMAGRAQPRAALCSGRCPAAAVGRGHELLPPMPGPLPDPRAGRRARYFACKIQLIWVKHVKRAFSKEPTLAGPVRAAGFLAANIWGIPLAGSGGAGSGGMGIQNRNPPRWLRCALRCGWWGLGCWVWGGLRLLGMGRIKVEDGEDKGCWG